MHDDHEIRPSGERDPKRIARKRFTALRELVQSDPDIERFREEASQRLQAIQHRLALPASHGYPRQYTLPSPHSSRGLRGFLTVGAGVVAGLAVFAVYRAMVPAGHSTTVSPVYATAIGERAAITLPDGSTVVLAPGSQLRDLSANGDQSGQERHVELHGEAFFAVVTNPDIPFIVVSGNVHTKVLGTSFTVRRYPSDSVAQVAVVTGKVATSRTEASEPVILTPGTIATVSDSSVTIRKGQDPANIAAWTDGKLIFDKTPVPVMLATIGRWYGYEFQLADSALQARHVSMVVRAGQRTETLEKIRAILGVTMSFDGRVVTLKPGQSRLDTLHRRSPIAPAATGVGK